MMATILCWIIVALHVAFALGETVGWNQMARRFGYNKEATETTRVLALNQGFYNAGLAGLLAWALLTVQRSTVIAVLICVVAMGIVGGLSARWTILVGQALPALLALAAVCLG